MYKARINKAWSYWANYFHSLPQSKGKELHHIFGRVGVLKGCGLLMHMVSKQEHNDPAFIKSLRVNNLATKQEVERNYERHQYCTREIRIMCWDCPMLRNAKDD
jgi:hypothetical protein